MIKVTSPYMKKCERDLLKRFAKFVCTVMVRNTALSNSALRKADIHIKVIKNSDLTEEDHPYNFRKFGAWVHNRGWIGGRKKYVIVLSASRLNRNAKKEYYRLRKLMLDVAHELVHIKQYLTGELFDYAAGGVRYKGEKFDYNPEMNDEKYYNSPWEIEAYGREQGMYKMFESMLKEEAKAKK